MPALKFFTWNLNSERDAHDLAVQHLASLSAFYPWIACLQELPGAGELAKAREGASPPAGMTVVKHENLSKAGKQSMPRAMGLAFSPTLTLLDAYADPDDEFVDARFQLPASHRSVRVIGLHAKAVVDMQKAEDRGASRALLRHAINARSASGTADHTVILGDWNSDCCAHEITSWHCFYALHRHNAPLGQRGLADRRGHPHPPFYVVMPGNSACLGTFAFEDSSESSRKTIDFIAVDGRTREVIHSEILTQVASSPVADPDGTPTSSDHLPVEGTLTF